MPSKKKVFTIGHSTHPLERFLSLLAQHRIEALADIRRFPGSREFPQFDQDDLASALQQADIEYHWLASLGGGRGKRRGGSATANLGLRNAGFRNYADYMLTPEFREGAEKLLETARRRRTALMRCCWRSCNPPGGLDRRAPGRFVARAPSQNKSSFTQPPPSGIVQQAREHDCPKTR